MNDIVEIKGRIYSVDTVANALRAYLPPEEEKPYQFQPGDVARAGDGDNALRVIVRGARYNEHHSVSLGGAEQSSNQEQYERHNYKKIGTLREIFKKAGIEGA